MKLKLSWSKRIILLNFCATKTHLLYSDIRSLAHDETLCVICIKLPTMTLTGHDPMLPIKATRGGLNADFHISC